MNLLINPRFHYLRAEGIRPLKDGDYALIGWDALSDSDDVVQFTQLARGLRLEWLKDGYAGLIQVVENGSLYPVRNTTPSFGADLSGDVILNPVLLEWSGSADKINNYPIASWSPLTTNTNWQQVTSVGNPSNLAVLFYGYGTTGDIAYIEDAYLGDQTFLHPVEEWKQCEWLYQHYNDPILRYVEYGYGRIYTSSAGDEAKFHFDLRNPLRGRDGAPGVNDMIIDWNANGWIYSNGYWQTFGVPSAQCHHRNFVFLGCPITNPNITPNHTCVFRLEPESTVTFDAGIHVA